MANGFKALRHVGGGVQRLSEYPIKAAYATKIYSGDAVEISTDQGYINRAAATAAAQSVGVFLGVSYVSAQGEIKYAPMWPGAQVGATDIRAIVTGDKNVSYKVEADAVTDASVGLPCDLVATVGNDSIGSSGMTVAMGAGAFVVRKILDDDANIVEVVAAKGLGEV